jgi:hypothetical protein
MSGDSESDPEVTKTTDEADLVAAIAAIRLRRDLPRPAYPMLPNLSTPGPMAAKVQAVQAYIEKLSYNFTGVNYFDVRKQRPMGRIMETARDVTRQALPIKCVEAVFLATYLTQGLRDLERVAVSFKSTVDGQTYKHIILALKHNSKWGSVGLSRRRELYYKELSYDSLAELVLEFKRSCVAAAARGAPGEGGKGQGAGETGNESAVRQMRCLTARACDRRLEQV